MGVSEGELPLKSWKNAFLKLNLQNLAHIFCQHFTENPLFFSNEILAIIMSIPLTSPFLFYDIGYYHVYSSNGVQSIVPLFNKKNILGEVKCIISGASVF